MLPDRIRHVYWPTGKALYRLISRRASARFRFGCPFSSKVMVCGHCLVPLSLTINETLKWHSPLPILMEESLWRWRCSDRYAVSLIPQLWDPGPRQYLLGDSSALGKLTLILRDIILLLLYCNNRSTKSIRIHCPCCPCPELVQAATEGVPADQGHPGTEIEDHSAAQRTVRAGRLQRVGRCFEVRFDKQTHIFPVLPIYTITCVSVDIYTLTSICHYMAPCCFCVCACVPCVNCD